MKTKDRVRKEQLSIDENKKTREGKWKRYTQNGQMLKRNKKTSLKGKGETEEDNKINKGHGRGRERRDTVGMRKEGKVREGKGGKRRKRKERKEKLRKREGRKGRKGSQVKWRRWAGKGRAIKGST